MLTERGRGAHSLPLAIYGGVGLAMLVAFGVTLVLHALDPRVLANHDSVWAKPLKFELALALHAGSLALVVARMAPPPRDGRWMRLVALVFLAACSVEMGYIIMQAARAEPSHFNDTTGFHRLMFAVMAFCAVFIIGAAGAIGATVWRDKGFHAPRAARAGVILGLMGGTILTLVTAFAIGGNGGPYVGTAPGPEARMALTGWSRAGGDLRIAHFLATHMIQVIPLAALCVAAFAAHRVAQGIVMAASAVWTAWTLLEFHTALGGNASGLARPLAVMQQWQ